MTVPRPQVPGVQNTTIPGAVITSPPSGTMATLNPQVPQTVQQVQMPDQANVLSDQCWYPIDLALQPGSPVMNMAMTPGGMTAEPSQTTNLLN